MPQGPGKYDSECTLVREMAQAQAAIVIVLNGRRGTGFSVQTQTPLGPAVLADLLDQVVRELRASPSELH